MYLTNWKEALPAGKVHASPAGRKPFQLLKGWVSEHTRQRLRMALSPEKAAGYPDAPGPALAAASPLLEQILSEVSALIIFFPIYLMFHIGAGES
jgi:hypothetical protein